MFQRSNTSSKFLFVTKLIIHVQREVINFELNET